MAQLACSQTNKINLLDVPIEVRLSSYHFLFHGVQVRVSHHISYLMPIESKTTASPFRNYAEEDSQFVSENFTPILSVNRQIREEALSVLAQHLHLFLPIMAAYSDFLPGIMLSCVRTLTVDLTMPWTTDRYTLFRNMPSLKTVILDMSHTARIDGVIDALSREAGSVQRGLGSERWFKRTGYEFIDERLQNDYVEWITRLRKIKPTFRVLCLFKSRSHGWKEGQAFFIDLMTGKDVIHELESVI